MTSLQPGVLFRLADDMLRNVELELNQNKGSILTHSVCFNSKQALFNYLKGHLVRQGIKPKQPITLGSLYAQCAEMDARFDSLNLDPVNCRDDVHKRELCRDRKQVVKCWKLAVAARDIVHSNDSEKQPKA